MSKIQRQGKGSHAGHALTVAINKRLEEVLTKVGDRLWVYADGVSDETIAAEFKCALGSVNGIRRDCFGNLRPPAVVNGNKVIDELTTIIANLQGERDALRGEIKLLKSDLEELRAEYRDLKLKWNALVGQLSLNRIVDVRHLELKDGARVAAH